MHIHAPPYAELPRFSFSLFCFYISPYFHFARALVILRTVFIQILNLLHKRRAVMGYDTIRYDTIRYDTRCYFNLRSKADMSQLNLPHGTDN